MIPGKGKRLMLTPVENFIELNIPKKFHLGENYKQFDGLWDDWFGTIVDDFIFSGGNLTYSHHPIAMIYELMEDRRFRHNTHKELCNLVYDCGQTRVQLPFAYVRGFEFALMGMQVNPKATAEVVAKYGGVSCLTCDGMAWGAPKVERTVLEDGAYCLHMKSLSDVLLFDHKVEEQWAWRNFLCNAPEARFGCFGNANYGPAETPVLCPPCFKIADKYVPERRYNITDADLLHGLNAILKSKVTNKSGVTNAKAHKDPSKRRARQLQRRPPARCDMAG